MKYRLEMGNERLRFQRQENDVVVDEVIAETGYEQVIRDFFTDEIPKDKDVELAIYHVEKEIMKAEQMIRKQKNTLWCLHPLVSEAFNETHDGLVSEEYVEG